MKYRKERDVLGSVNVPADAYYGSETQRAIDNFQISGLHIQKEFILTYIML
jgi:fumarate hydratase class II